MKFTAAELAEIRSAFHQRIATAPPRKRAARPKPKQRALPALVSEPEYDDGDILRAAQMAKLFGRSQDTIGRWADAGMLPSFRRSADSGGSGGATFGEVFDPGQWCRGSGS
jgi:hypothetical protein